MTAWTLLTANSAAPEDADAWAHLNNQQAGGETIVIGGGLRTADKPVALSARLAWSANAEQRLPILSANRPVEISAGINKILEASVCR